MNKKLAFTVVDKYFKAWLRQDEELFLAQLHKDIIVKECTGDMYDNKQICQKWFRGWNIEGNKVLRWDITDRYYDEINEVAVVKWVFECSYEYDNHVFAGVSIVGFKDELIIRLDEYQMEINKKYPYGKGN